MIKVDSSEAKFDASKYVCAQCWGSLTIWPDPGDRNSSILKCNTPDCKCDGIVRQSTVDRKLAESRAEKQAAIRATRDLVPWVAEMFPQQQKSEEQIMKTLGY